MWVDDYKGSFEISTYQQFENTNIEELLTKIQKFRNLYLEQCIKTFYSDVFFLPTAVSSGLDAWGKVLNFPRFLRLPLDNKPDPSIQEFSFYDCNFHKLHFKNVTAADYIELRDKEYRIILMMLLQKQNILPDIVSINILNKAILADLGVAVVVTNSEDMEPVNFVSTEILPKWFEYLITNYDIILRPLCLGTKITIDLRKPIGFERTDGTSEKISNFYYSNFEKVN